MNKYLKLIFVVIIAFIFNIFDVYAEECDSEDIDRLRVLASNIKVSYENVSDMKTYDIKYLVSFSNVDKELIIVDSNYNQWDGKNAKDGVISFEREPEYSSIKYRIYSDKCSEKSLKTFSVELPMFNSYYDSDECKRLSKYNLNVCQEWTNDYIDDEIFLDTVEKYNIKEENSSFNIIKYVSSHIYLVVIAGVLLFGLVIFLIIRARKRSVLE